MGYRQEVDGSWTAFFSKRHPSTGQPVSRRRVGLKSQNEARRVEKELVAVVVESFRKETVPIWKTLVEGYLESCRLKDLTKKTIYNAQCCLIKATYPKWEFRLVDTITTEEIRELVRVSMSNSSPSHQKSVLKFIRGVFNYGIESGVLRHNPAPQLKFFVGDKIKKVLTETQLKLFLDKANEYRWEWYPHVMLACYTGMRNGELYALRWDKVDLESRKIIVDCSWNNKDGFKDTKSGHDRVVEIAPGLVPFLKQLKLQMEETGFVLPRIGRWDKGEQARELRMFLTGIGLPEIRFHDLRASWATMMLMKGIEPIRVMSMGGWRDLKTMMVYIRKAGVDITGITDQLDLHDPYARRGQVLQFASGEAI